MCILKKMLTMAIVGTIVCGQPVLASMKARSSSSSATGGKGLHGNSKTHSASITGLLAHKGAASSTKEKTPQEIAKAAVERRAQVLNSAAAAEHRNRARNKVAAHVSNVCAVGAGMVLPALLFPGLGSQCGNAACTLWQTRKRIEVATVLVAAGIAATKVCTEGFVKYVAAPAIEQVRLFSSRLRTSFGEKVFNEDIFLQSLTTILQDISSDISSDNGQKVEINRMLQSLQRQKRELEGLGTDLQVAIDTLIRISQEYSVIIGQKGLLDNATRAIKAGGKDTKDRDAISNCLNSFIQNYRTNVFLVVDSCEQCGYSAEKYAELKTAVASKKLVAGVNFVELISDDAFYADLASNNEGLLKSESFKMLCIAALFDFKYTQVDDYIRLFIITSLAKYNLPQKQNKDAAPQQRPLSMAAAQGIELPQEGAIDAGSLSSSSTSSTLTTTMAQPAESNSAAPLPMNLETESTESASVSTSSSSTTSAAMDTAADSSPVSALPSAAASH